jgi:parallel beta-helix repeat protein
LKRGITCKGRVVPTGSGTSTHRITLGAYGRGARPTVAGSGTSTQTAAVQLTDVQYWTVQDLRVTNTGSSKRTTSYRSGVMIVNTGVGRLKGLAVQRLLVENVSSNVTMRLADAREWGGIVAMTYGIKNDGFDNLSITHNTVRNVSRTGITISNKENGKGWDVGARISYNTVSGSRGDGIVLRGSRNARIDHNLVANNGKMLPCPECKGQSPDTANAGIWPALAQNIVIDHNEVYGQHAWGGDGEGFDIDSSTKNVVMEYNYAHDNQGGGVLFCGSSGAVARFNIFQNNTKSAFAFIGTYPAKKTAIYNNTVYNSGKSRARIVRYFNGARGTGISFKNNLLYNYSYASYLWPTKKVTTSSNTLIGLHSSGRPTDSRTSWLNPGLKNVGSGKNGFASLKGYKPAHPSTFKRGVAIPKSVTRDFFGKKINPANPPRGAAG